MRRNMIFAAAIASAALLSALPASSYPGSLAMSQEPGTIERGFDVGAGGILEVNASFGSIEVTTSGADRVEVRVVREIRERNRDDSQQILSEHQVTVSQSGDNIAVTAEVSDDARDRWRDAYNNTPLRVSFEISVPRSYNVDLETRGGNIEVSDLDGEVRTETAGGNLTLGNINGAVWAHTSGGNIELGGSSGTVEVKTSGGNIAIGEVGGTIDATTSGGNVTASITSQPAGDCRLETSAGTVTVTLAAGIAVDVDASTSVGNVTSDFAVDGRVTRGSVRGAINGGGPQLRLRTSAGSIRIRQG